MGKHELYVHIAAPSLVRDDAKWKNVARGIAQFRPTAAYRVLDEITNFEDPGTARTVVTRNIAKVTNCTVTSREDSKIDGEYSESSQLNPRARKRAVEFHDHGDYKHAKRAKRVSSEKSKHEPRPMSCNSMQKASKQEVPEVTTPLMQNPKTAGYATILIPQTDSPKHGRSTSVRGGMPSGCSGYHRSSRGSPDAVDETAFDLRDQDIEESLVVPPLHRRPHESGALSSPSGHRLKSSRVALHRATPSDGPTEVLEAFYSSLHDSKLEVGTCLPHTMFNADVETPSPTTSREVCSSADGHTLTNAQTESVLWRSVPQPRSTRNQDTHFSGSRRVMLGPISSPPERDIGTSRSTRTTSPQTLLTILGKLPRELWSPAPIMSRSSEGDVLAEGLSKLASDYNLINHFRPTHVKRRVWKRERGYWKVIIFIRPAAMVYYARSKPETLSQRRDRKFVMVQDGQLPPWASTDDVKVVSLAIREHDLPADVCTLWTIDEFEQFWRSVEKMIIRGRAGNLVRALLNRVKPDAEGVEVEVRLYSHAEVLTHVWLMLVGLSNGLIQQMPIQWYGHDAQVVLSMSGQGRGAHAGLWTEGRDGTWGPDRLDGI